MKNAIKKFWDSEDGMGVMVQKMKIRILCHIR